MIDTLLNSREFVLVDFWMPNCRFCHLMMPAVNAIARSYPEMATFKINLHEQKGLGERMAIKALPTLILFRNGQEAGRLEGQHPFHVLDNMVKEQLHGNLVLS